MIAFRYPCVAAIWLVLSLVAAPLAAQSRQDTVREAARHLLGPTFTAAQIDSVATVIEQQIATFPIGASSGSFRIVFATPERPQLENLSFGPLFAERAQTLKQGLAIGVSLQSTSFVSFENRRLRNGELRSRTVFGGQLVDINRFTFDLQMQTTSLSAHYAMTEHLDVGVLVPVITTSLNGTSSALTFPTLQREERIVDTSQTGLGDIAVRAKWQFLPLTGGGLAATVDLFMPTGSEERLSSTGHVRLRPQFVASGTIGSFSPHVNVGYTFGGPGVEVTDDGITIPVIVSAEASDEVNYVVGGDVGAHESLTVFADLIGRYYRSVVRFDEGQRVFPSPVGPLPVETFVARAGTLHTRVGAVGARVRVFDKGLISAALLFPLNGDGLKPGLTPLVGFEYNFAAPNVIRAKGPTSTR